MESGNNKDQLYIHLWRLWYTIILSVAIRDWFQDSLINTKTCQCKSHLSKIMFYLHHLHTSSSPLGWQAPSTHTSRPSLVSLQVVQKLCPYVRKRRTTRGLPHSPLPVCPSVSPTFSQAIFRVLEVTGISPTPRDWTWGSLCLKSVISPFLTGS